MNRADHDGQLRRQCYSLGDLCARQIEGCKEGMEQTIPNDILKDIRRVILTGCGDSLLAAQAAADAFKKYAGAFASSFTAYPAIEVGRKLDLDDNPGACLVIAISASGHPARIEEVLLRANEHGCHSLLVTNDPDSRGAKAAEYIFNVHTPVFPEPGPGLRNYYASLLGLFTLACKMGIAKGFHPAEALDELYDEVRELTDKYLQMLEAEDEQLFETAVAWKDIEMAEAVGDHAALTSARFIAAKLTETVGLYTGYANVEDWCHLNAHIADVSKICTILVGNSQTADQDRVLEVLELMKELNRKVLYITDGKMTVAGGKIVTIKVPEAGKDFAFLRPLVDHLPGSVLASYLASLKAEPYFRGKESRQVHSAVGNTIGSSQVVIG